MNQQVIDQLERNALAAFRPRGHSMSPRIKSGQQVIVDPNINNLQVNDIVFCRVHGNLYVHKIKAIKDGRYLISNLGGHENGYASKIYGKVIAVNP